MQLQNKKMGMVLKVHQIATALEQLAPSHYKESYDNVGLLVGEKEMVVSGILLTLDCTVPVLQDALQQKCNVVVAHHPIIFGGLKKITGSNYVEQVVLFAIKNNIAIIACHTNLDNMKDGVNKKICEKIGLHHIQILAPKQDLLYKLALFAPKDAAAQAKQQLFAAGAGQIGLYSECSFSTSGTGTFAPQVGSLPKIGATLGGQENVIEEKIEVLFAQHQMSKILNTVHALDYYEEKAFDIIPLQNAHQDIGSGMVGTLPKPMQQQDFLQLLQKTFGAKSIKYTPCQHQLIEKVAVCGGSGSFLLKNAIGAGAHAFVSADFKYHEFFDAEGKIMICDIGHYESEQYTAEIFRDFFQEKFPNFASRFTTVNTNPVQYFN